MSEAHPINFLSKRTIFSTYNHLFFNLLFFIRRLPSPVHRPWPLVHSPRLQPHVPSSPSPMPLTPSPACPMALFPCLMPLTPARCPQTWATCQIFSPKTLPMPLTPSPAFPMSLSPCLMPLTPARRPLNWDTCQTFSPQTSPMSPKLGHLSSIHPPNRPGVPQNGTPVKHPPPKPPRCPFPTARCPPKWDTCQASTPQTCPMSQFWGHRAGIAGTTTGKASPPGRQHRLTGTAAGIKDLRRLKTGRCGGLWGKALLAPGFCLKSFPR